MLDQLLAGVKRLRGRSPHEFMTRAKQRMWVLRERLDLRMRAERGSRALAPQVRAATSKQFYAQPFFAGTRNTDATIAALRVYAANDESEILERAAAVTRGEIAIFGHGLVPVGNPPLWQRDSIAGVTAPGGHWSTIPYLNPSVAGDHKVIWEINRHQYFITLAQAWLYTRDEQWPRTFAQHIRSWIADNPATSGMNWASSLEVSYRAIAWIWALRLFEGAPGIDDVLTAEIVQSLDQHARHLSRHLSTYFSPNTHLTGEALGLFYIGSLCPTLKDSAKWAALGATVLEKELDRQLLPDGVYFEQATQYHRYTIEIYLHYLLLARGASRTVDKALLPALEQQFDVLLNITRGDGTIPLVGDDDGGRLLPVDVRTPDDVRSLLAIGAVLLRRSDLAWLGHGDDAMLCWTLGPEAPSERDALRNGAPAHRAKAFADGGVYVIREGWNLDDGQMVIDAGPFGGLSFGHSHSDALAVELSVGGGPLFVDGGTYTYVGAERDAFRSTASHNTVEIDDTSAATPGTAFRWKTVSHARATNWVDDKAFTFFSGVHDGYERLQSPVTHQRSVLHPARGVWIVRDDLMCKGEHSAAVRWRCAPGLTAQSMLRSSLTSVVRVSGGSGPRATLAMLAGEGDTIAIESGYTSRQFGRKEPSDVCVWRKRIVGDATLVSVVIDDRKYAVVAADENDALTETAKGSAIALSDRENPRLQHHVFVGHNAPLNVFGTVQIDANLAWITSDQTSGAMQAVTAVGARLFIADGQTVVSDSEHASWVVANSEQTVGEQRWSARSGRHSVLS